MFKFRDNRFSSRVLYTRHVISNSIFVVIACFNSWSIAIASQLCDAYEKKLTIAEPNPDHTHLFRPFYYLVPGKNEIITRLPPTESVPRKWGKPLIWNSKSGDLLRTVDVTASRGLFIIEGNIIQFFDRKIDTRDTRGLLVSSIDFPVIGFDKYFFGPGKKSIVFQESRYDGTWQNRFEWLDLMTGTRRTFLTGEGEKDLAEISIDGKKLLTYQSDRSVGGFHYPGTQNVWDLDSGELEGTFKRQCGRNHIFASFLFAGDKIFHRDSYGNSIGVCKLQSDGKVGPSNTLHRWKHPVKFVSLNVTPDGLLQIALSNTIRFYDPITLQLKSEIPLPSDISYNGYTSNNKKWYLQYGWGESTGQVIHIFNLETKTFEKTVFPERKIYKAKISDDGKSIVTETLAQEVDILGCL